MHQHRKGFVKKMLSLPKVRTNEVFGRARKNTGAVGFFAKIRAKHGFMH